MPAPMVSNILLTTEGSVLISFITYLSIPAGVLVAYSYLQPNRYHYDVFVLFVFRNKLLCKELDVEIIPNDLLISNSIDLSDAI